MASEATDPLEVYQKLTTCLFCTRRYKDVVKHIPDCGNSICGYCYSDLKESFKDGSREYECQACGDHHNLPNKELKDSIVILELLRNPIEKPLTDRAKKLQLVIETVQEELAKLNEFDAKQVIHRHCDELDVQVGDAADSAIKHIRAIERGLYEQIEEYRQRRLNALTTGSSGSSDQDRQLQAKIEIIRQQRDDLSQEISTFHDKWKTYFSRLKESASDVEIEDALCQADALKERAEELDQRMRDSAFAGTILMFDPKVAFHSESGHLGQLQEIAAGIESVIQETPSQTMTGHSDDINKVIFLPDGRLASCSDDKTIKVWDAVSGQALFTFSGHTDQVLAIVLLSNGWLASGSRDKTIKLWNLAERKEVRTLKGHSNTIVDLKVLKNGYLVSYSGDDTIKVWDPFLSENNLLFTLKGHGNEGWSITMGVLSNDFLVTCSRDQQDKEEQSILRVWDTDAGELVKTLSTGLKEVNHVLALSNDQVAIGTEDGTIKIIDLKDEPKSRVKQKAHDRLSRLLQLSNENLISAGRDKDSSGFIRSIKVWKFSDLSLLQNIKTGHSHSILALSISKDESLLASAGQDNTIKLWPISIKLHPDSSLLD